MNTKTLFGVSIALLVVLVVAVQSIFVVDQRELALVTQFGEPVEQYSEPGLKFKLPFIQQVQLFDNRIMNLNADTSEVIAADQKTMRVDAFAKYKIIDPLRFFQTAVSDNRFKTRLETILDSSMRQVLGSRPFSALLSKERSELMGRIQKIVQREANGFGVDVSDVRIMRADLPETARNAVHERMITDRQKEAMEIRAQGAEAAQRIVADADKTQVLTLAEARKEAEILRGTGDAESISIFGKAVGKDPEFYDFYRSLEAYKKSIRNGDTSIVLSPKSDFLKFLTTGNGKK
jgi:membrane protease subunit HflC